MASGWPNTKCCANTAIRPSEAFNETVEEATQSLYPLIAENGMDWMYANCSTTAQRGALDWFKKLPRRDQAGVREALQERADGDETRRVLETNSKADYRQGLEKELKEVADSELWQAGKAIRELRRSGRGSNGSDDGGHDNTMMPAIVSHCTPHHPICVNFTIRCLGVVQYC